MPPVQFGNLSYVLPRGALGMAMISGGGGGDGHAGGCDGGGNCMHSRA